MVVASMTASMARVRKQDLKRAGIVEIVERVITDIPAVEGNISFLRTIHTTSRLAFALNLYVMKW